MASTTLPSNEPSSNEMLSSELSSGNLSVSDLLLNDDLFRKVVEYSVDGLLVIDPHGIVQFANPAAIALFAGKTDHLLGFHLGVPVIHEPAEIILPGGNDLCYVEMRTAEIDWIGGPASLANLRDITRRKRADDEVRRVLEEKSVMLNEIHHRVKNNLQVVSSLLSLQAGEVRDPVARRMFDDSQNRIQSMALVHQQLYTSSNFAEIDFSAYLRLLSNHVLSIHASEAFSFRVALDALDTVLSVTDAIPCGLIVNELISNSLKHAFHNRSTGQIKVGFSSANGFCTLTVDDDGSPLPQDMFATRPPTMGIRLVQALTSQLRGQLHTGSEPKFKVTFPDRRAKAA